MAQGSQDALRIRLFGHFEVCRGETPISRSVWGRGKTQTLLKILITEMGHVVSHDQLIEWLFPDLDPQKALQNLYARVSDLRRLLEPELETPRQSHLILHIGNGYAFNERALCWIDAREFQRSLMAGRRAEETSRWEEATAAYQKAKALYRGDYLEEDRYEEWSLVARERYREAHLDGLACLSNTYARLGQHAQAAKIAWEAVALSPTREPLIRQVMRYAYLAGDQATALEAYRKGVATLEKKLGVKPSEETEHLYQEIVQHRLPSPVVLRGDPRRIAVLPLANLGPDPADEYLADGLTEELIARLAKISELRVIARTSIMQYKRSSKRVAEIGRELGVGTVLEGSIRKTGERLRIAVQLVNASSEDHLWSQEYDWNLKEFLSLQQEIAQKVAEALQVRLAASQEDAKGRGSTNLEALTTFLKGMYSWNKGKEMANPAKMMAGVEKFKKAVALDPSFALAYAALADTYSRSCYWGFLPPKEAVPTARAAVEKALALDDTLTEAYYALGFINMYFEWDWLKAESSLKRAITINPNDAEARQLLALLLICLGQFDEGIAQMQLALDLDPMSVEAHKNLGQALFFSGRNGEAVKALRRTIAMGQQGDPSVLLAHWLLGLVYLHGYGDYEKALSQFKRAQALSPRPDPMIEIQMAITQARKGQKEPLRQGLDKVIENAEKVYASPFWIAEGLFALGEADAGFAWLEKAYEEHDWVMIVLGIAPCLVPYRSDPRYLRLLRKMNLPVIVLRSGAE